jgi:hypothetical protein
VSLNDLINVQISVAGTAPSAANFGVPMIAAYHTHYSSLIRYYSSLAGLVGDGFKVTDPAYLAAEEILDQIPNVTQFAVGRRQLAPTQTVNLTLLSASTLDIYAFTITDPNGHVHTVTVPSSGVPTTDAATLAALFPLGPVVASSSNTGNLLFTASGTPTVVGVLTVSITTAGAEGTAKFSWTLGSLGATGVTTSTSNVLAGTGLTLDFTTGTAVVGDSYTVQSNPGTGTVTHSAGVVTWTQTAGLLNNFASWGLPGAAGAPIITLHDSTADPGIATDLAAIYAVDQGWYGGILDSNSPAEVTAAASWFESNGMHVFCWNTSEATVASGAVGSLFLTLQADSFARDMGQFNGSELLSYGGAAILGVILPKTPGSYTAAYKTEVGVPADPTSVLTENVQNNIVNANGNYYTTYKGVPVLISGITPSGEYLDTTIGIDWLTDTIRTAFFTALTNNPKIPYTDPGVAILVNILYGILKQAISNGLLAGSPAPVVTAPPVATIALSSVAKRNYPGMAFTATLAGAIQGLTLNGSVVLP